MTINYLQRVILVTLKIVFYEIKLKTRLSALAFQVKDYETI